MSSCNFGFPDVGFVRNSDVQSACGERPISEKANFAPFKVRFRENELHCREILRDVMRVRLRSSPHLHLAAKSAIWTFAAI